VIGVATASLLWPMPAQIARTAMLYACGNVAFAGDPR
jgi:hypothetical protein